jgi:hypothetical protein
MHLGDAEQVKGRCDADRVDHRVQPADLMQVHLRRVDAVDPRLDLRNRPYRRRGNPGAGPGPFDVREQLGRAPLGGGVGDLDDGPGSTDPAARDALGGELPTGEPGAPHRIPHPFQRGAEVEQRAEQHVAGDPAERVEPEDHR